MSMQNEPQKPKQGADIGGAGNQHNDWGHSDVGNKQSDSRLDDVVGSDTGFPPRRLASCRLAWVGSVV